MNCDKFEKLFIQETQDELLKHIQNCEICMLEYKKMVCTENLIKEVKPHFIIQAKSRSFAKIAASFALVAVSSLFILNNFYIPKLSYEESISSSFPVDEYGLMNIR
jgi:hypothetical protein